MGFAQAAKTADKICTRKDDCLLELVELNKKAAAKKKVLRKQEGNRYICICERQRLGPSRTVLSLKEDKKPPLLSYGANSELPGASHCLALRYKKEMGRHIVATRDINPGDVLMVERPYASFLEPDCFYTHCSVCFKRCPSLLPCEKCTWAMFCSENCRLSAPHHSLECSLMPKLLAWNIPMNLSFLMARIISMEGEDKILTYLDNLPTNDDPRTQGFTDGKLKSNFQALYHLERNSNLRTPDDFIHFCVIAWCLVKVMALTPKFEGFMVRLVQLLSINVFHVSEDIIGLNGKDCDKSLEYAVLISSSMFSHSCNANVTKNVTSNKENFFYATQPMKKGDLVTINYGWNFMDCPKVERQEKLLTKYHFLCCCEACVEDWPLNAQSPWQWLPLTYRKPSDKVACEKAVRSVKDIWQDVLENQEYRAISAKDTARIGRNLKVMWSLGATKCYHYQAFLVYFERCLCQPGSRFQGIS